MLCEQTRKLESLEEVARSRENVDTRFMPRERRRHPRLRQINVDAFAMHGLTTTST